MLSRITKYTLIALFITMFFVSAGVVKADAPDIEVKIMEDKEGTLIPVGGGMLRWRNEGKGSYKDYNEADKNTWPRRYGQTDPSGSYLFKAFQDLKPADEYAKVFDGYADADFPGIVRAFQPLNGKFGCGQVNHKIAANVQGYKCDQYQIQDGQSRPFTAATCANGWCEGPFAFSNCTNGCAKMSIVFKCQKEKEQKVTTLTNELKGTDVGLADDEKAKFGFACTTASLCSTEPAPTGPNAVQNTQCSDNPKVGSGKKRVKLTGVKSLYDRIYAQKKSENIPAYLVECINSGSNYTCTTGNASQDTTIFGKSNVPAGYSIKYFKEKATTSTMEPVTNPVTWATLDEELEAESTFNGPIKSVFMLVFPKQQTDAVQVGIVGGQQQATLSFTTGCQLVQDPYGRVFDSYTLEPLSNSNVTLSKRSAKGDYTVVKQSDISASKDVGSIENPYATKQDGLFSFYVPDGTYKLSAEKTGYSFSGDLSKVNPAHKGMYKNLYIGEDIVQKGQMEHRDIPMDPENVDEAVRFSKTNKVTFTNYFQSVDKAHNQYIIEGSVSHPLARVSVYGSKVTKSSNGRPVRTRLLRRVDADMFGRFRITFDMNMLQKDETVGEMEAVKVQVPYLKNVSYASPAKETMTKVWEAFTSLFAVEAAERDSTSTVRLNPILTNIRGYAKDLDGSILPGAKVGVYLPFSEKPVYETVADEKGYFTITNENLPETEYEIRFTSLADAEIAMTTDQFVAMNSAESSVQYFAKAKTGDSNVLGVSDEAQTEDGPNLFVRMVGLSLLGVLLFVVSLSVILSQMKLKQRRSRS